MERRLVQAVPWQRTPVRSRMRDREKDEQRSVGEESPCRYSRWPPTARSVHSHSGDVRPKDTRVSHWTHWTQSPSDYHALCQQAECHPVSHDGSGRQTVKWWLVGISYINHTSSCYCKVWLRGNVETPVPASVLPNGGLTISNSRTRLLSDRHWSSNAFLCEFGSVHMI